MFAITWPTLSSQTVGDAYIASTGCIPRAATGITALKQSARKLARLAAAMQALCSTFTCPDGTPLQMRIGLVAGPGIGGVVGSSMLRCGSGSCVWCARQGISGQGLGF